MSTESITALCDSYAEARARFLTAAAQAGAEVTAHVHPLTGLDGEELAIDVARLGPIDAERVLVVVSATHGVEGYCGSALQTHWLGRFAETRPDDVRVLLVHGFNPFGFSWVRRVNEDNVDLNRNFIDWTAPVPSNPEYGRLARDLVPREWSEAEQERTFTNLLGFVNEHGLEYAQDVISRGQYDDPTGVFHGGSGPVWSHRWIRDWAPPTLAAARRVGIIDLHTGLGPWGHGELIGHEPSGSPEHRRAVSWWGEVIPMGSSQSVSAELQGDWLGVVSSFAPHAEVTAAALEYGTVDPITVLQALRADAWLHAHGDPRSPDAAAIRAQVRAAFADDDPAWIAPVWDRFAEVVDAAFAGLTAPEAG